MAAIIWVGGCTQPRVPPPDAARDAEMVTPPERDASPDADAVGPVIVRPTGCLGPGERDARPRGTFEVTACQHRMASGGRMVAVFTWANQTGEQQTAPYGPENQVSPGSEAQGQPTSFPIGAYGYGWFAVPFDGSIVTWTILGQSVAVSQESPDCGSLCEYLQPVGPDGFIIDTCTHACGDGVCDYWDDWDYPDTYEEVCTACPADCDCGSLSPLVDCVVPQGGGKKLVSFGYHNSAPGGLLLLIGPENQFLPGQRARGQTVRFEAGEHHSVFQVTYDGPDVTWMLAGKAVTVPADAPVCSQSCSSCPPGTTCVDDECRGSCGDGLCADGERCWICPEDCACSAGEVCPSTF